MKLLGSETKKTFSDKARKLIGGETRKRALVLAISAYDHAPSLANATRDGRDIARELRAVGFDVEDYYDLDLNNLTNAISNCLERGFDEKQVGKDPNIDKHLDVILVYYAGHGLQFGDKNYIVPKDFDPHSYLPLSRLMPVELLLDQMDSKAAKKILFLDACRDNGGLQIAHAGTAVNQRDRSLSGAMPAELNRADGLGQVERLLSPAIGIERLFSDRRQGFAAQSLGELNQTFIAFSASPGETALDGPKDGNSPFTAGVLKYMHLRGLSLFDMCQAVARHVRGETDGKQVPWNRSNLTDKFSLHEATQLPVLVLTLLGMLAGAMSAMLNFDLLKFSEQGELILGDGRLKNVLQDGNEALILTSGLMGLVLALGVYIWAERRYRILQATVAFCIYLVFSILSRFLFAPIIVDQNNVDLLGQISLKNFQELLSGSFMHNDMHAGMHNENTAITYLITVLFFAILAGGLTGLGTVACGAPFHRELRRAIRVVAGAAMGMVAPMLFIVYLVGRQLFAETFGWDRAGLNDGQASELEVLAAILAVAIWHGLMAWTVGRAYANPYYDKL